MRRARSETSESEEPQLGAFAKERRGMREAAEALKSGGPNVGREPGIKEQYDEQQEEEEIREVDIIILCAVE